ncbi:PHA/PHB synthase family protein [Hyphomicrobium sp.]|uniref:PHA/PHB synthase family protein n=1 Tax=Hyphomicrobium sp. TaxID=82 RepID=UPI002FDD0658
MNEQTPSPPSPYRIENPEEFVQNLARFFEQGGRAFAELLERPDAQISPYSAASEMSNAATTLGDVARLWLADPAKLAEAQTSLISSYVDLWNTSLRRFLGEDVDPVVEPEPSDNRFKDPEWSSNPYFDFWKQAYLLTTHWAEDVLQQTEGLDTAARQKAEFYLRQLSSALSPSNFPMTNPEVMRETFATNARNLVEGMAQLARDMEKSGDLLKISQTDTEAFEVGKNLATTPGKVVFENEIFQLIQYAPTTDKVRERPLLVIPPWINKYYILDLTPPKSFLKFAVDQGLTVFVISWVNPDERLAHKTFEDYMLEGVLTAADAVRRETGSATSNVVGYCVGGTLLGATLAYLAARGEAVFNSVTFLTTQLDFSKAGDLLLFTNDAQLASLEEMMAERGYLDGSRMANVFNMMRPRDLIWPYIVNNYLLGRKPFPFDLLYWNQDSTRMPAANHGFYLKEFYNENRLAKGEMTLAGVKLDLKKVKLPTFELATRDDHIAPAKSVFIGSKLLGGPVEFVLAGSGHIAGVINPPDRMKYQHWTANKAAAETLEEWIGMAKEHPGSWWPYWANWIARHAGEWTSPREPGQTLGVIEDAPGSYVKTKS